MNLVKSYMLLHRETSPKDAVERMKQRTDSTRLAPVPLMRRLSSVSLVRAALSPSDSRPWASPEPKMRRILSAFLFRAAFSPSDSRPETFPDSKMRRRLKKKQVGAAGTLFSGPFSPDRNRLASAPQEPFSGPQQTTATNLPQRRRSASSHSTLPSAFRRITSAWSKPAASAAAIPSAKPPSSRSL